MRLADFVGVRSFFAAFDFLTAPEMLDFVRFVMALDLPLCDCFTGARYAEVRLTLAN